MARSDLNSTDVMLGVVVGGAAGFVLGKWSEKDTGKKQQTVQQRLKSQKEKDRVKKDTKATHAMYLDSRRPSYVSHQSSPRSHHNFRHSTQPSIFESFAHGSNGNPGIVHHTWLDHHHNPSYFEQGLHSLQNRLHEIPHPHHLPFADHYGGLNIKPSFQNPFNHNLLHQHRHSSHGGSIQTPPPAIGSRSGHPPGHCGYSPLCSYNDGFR